MKKFLKGMHKDAERVDMPESTYRDALNANLYFTKGSVVNEQGNSLVGSYTYPIDNIIGQCALEDGRIVIFAIDSYPDGDQDIIALADPNLNTYQVLYRNSGLNFQKDYTIEATSKVDSKGQIKVYFTDNYIRRLTDAVTGIDYVDDYNPPRVFDVTKQLESLGVPSDPTVLYGDVAYTVDKLDLFMHSGSIPEFTTVEIVEGGGVNSGTYHLALAYMDEDRNTTNYLVTSNAVHVVTAHEDTLPTEAITGDPQGSQSNKSITWNFQIPATNRNYTHLQPVVIQRSGGGQNQPASEFAYALDPIKIAPGTFQSITYTGLETVASSSISEVVIDSVRYEAAKSIVQLDNRLYIANLQSRGDLGYQRFANSITLEAVTETVERFDPRHFDILNINKGYTDLTSVYSEKFFRLESTINDIYKPIQGNDHPDLGDEQKSKFSGRVRKGYKDVSLSYKKKSYRRSEVYAFYISFVLKDGTETYGYHIPGRKAVEIGDTGYFENEPVEDHTSADFFVNTGVFTSEIAEQFESAKLHQFSDTQVILRELGEDNANISTNFWENTQELYPFDDNYLVYETDQDGNAVEVDDFRGQKVRHHKMPSNKHKDYSFITGIESWDLENGNMHTQFSPTLTGWPDENHTLNLEETIRLLGIKLSNIYIPKFILKQVQGYKIYYAKRRQRDKTILDQSVPVPAGLKGNVAISMDTSIAKFGPYHRAWWMWGGIPPDTEYYPKVDSKFTDTDYWGFPVFGFHGFNMLKNKHTLTGATHVDIQNILVYRHYGGGPHVKNRPNTNIFVGTEWGPNAKIGNDVFPNYDPDTDGSFSTTSGIRAFVTAAFLATGYFEPDASGYSSQFNMGSDSDRNWLSNTRTVYTLQPKSKTYLPGHTMLEQKESGGFHGAGYLMNFAGESSIAIGLSSALPMLSGYQLNAGGWDGLYTAGGRFFWYPDNGWLNPANGAPGNFNWSMNLNRPYVTEYDDAPNVGGHAASYLVNLCSLKENVYDSFDEQQLVWTGYYKSLNDIDLETGEDSKGEQNYFTGASTEDIFGGDTYITRYGFRTTFLTYGHHYYKGSSQQPLYTDIPFNLSSGFTGDAQVWPPSISANEGLATGSANDSLGGVWGIGNNSPIASIFYFFCESDDLIGYRHSADAEEGVLPEEGRFFDGATASSVIFNSPINDNTKMENMLYMNNYSLNQDLRVTTPLPKKLDDIVLYPTRTIRSNGDEGSISDKYREYLALEFKDIPKNRGSIWDIFTLGSVLYIHAEKSLFVTKGKENLQLGDASQAFIGSGDIFAQDPDELLPTTEGYGGTDAQFASITTRYGHFYVNRKSRKVFMYSSQIEELSALGMEKWFLDNIPYRLEDYGIDLDQNNAAATDAPTDQFGFTAAYDPKYKRIILTKRERVPTALFITEFNDGLIQVISNQFRRGGGLLQFTNDLYFQDGGWTLSYYPETKVWGSRHSYIPRLYSYNSFEYYSLVNSADVATGQVWEHSDDDNPGSFFGTTYNFEFEFIDNKAAGASKVFSNVMYWTEVQANSNDNATGQVTKHTSPGFTSYFVYNTKQISGAGEDINYLSNIRLVDKFWYINDFRDKSLIQTLTNNELVTGVVNVQDNFTTGVDAATQAVTMFTDEGVVNANYIDDNKQWYDQRRFVDHYLGVRLICDNSTRNLVHLFAAGTKHRKSYR